ncbi:gamma subclass chorismate mutase AroQ [Streptomyces sp. NPDC051569]|uniref:gamma subclass chorismate mutase AroQ n=1 Tax=Streptomyces sp. NPDC051569 TaxID=3365661 RepID=UPI0037AF4B80
MDPTGSVRGWLTAGAAATALLLGAGTAAALPAGGPGPSALQPDAGPSALQPGADPVARLRPVAGLSARRLAIADLVAAAKRGTGSPVDDPVRERRVLDTVAHRARERGADPVATVRIFRDQIAAGKAVQRALLRRWDADPAEAPAGRPELSAVRAEIDRVDDALVRALARAAPDRATPHCGGVLRASAALVRTERRPDAVHAAALRRSLRSVCAAAEFDPT